MPRAPDDRRGISDASREKKRNCKCTNNFTVAGKQLAKKKDLVHMMTVLTFYFLRKDVNPLGRNLLDVLDANLAKYEEEEADT